MSEGSSGTKPKGTIEHVEIGRRTLRCERDRVAKHWKRERDVKIKIKGHEFDARDMASDEPLIDFVDVTPEIAALWLAKNIANNRNRSERNIKDFARKMANGEWYLTSQGIGFTESGAMADGQNRLAAIVSSGKTIKVAVAVGLSGRFYLGVDVGKRRTLRDALKMLMPDEPHIRIKGEVASAVASIYYGHNANLHPEEARVWIEANRVVLNWVVETLVEGDNTAHRPPAMKYAPTLAAFVIAYAASPEMVDALARQLASLKTAGQGPVSALADYFMQQSRASRENTKSATLKDPPMVRGRKTLYGIKMYIERKRGAKLLDTEETMIFFTKANTRSSLLAPLRKTIERSKLQEANAAATFSSMLSSVVKNSYGDSEREKMFNARKWIIANQAALPHAVERGSAAELAKAINAEFARWEKRAERHKTEEVEEQLGLIY